MDISALTCFYFLLLFFLSRAGKINIYIKIYSFGLRSEVIQGWGPLGRNSAPVLDRLGAWTSVRGGGMEGSQRSRRDKGREGVWDVGERRRIAGTCPRFSFRRARKGSWDGEENGWCCLRCLAAVVVPGSLFSSLQVRKCVSPLRDLKPEEPESKPGVKRAMRR